MEWAKDIKEAGMNCIELAGPITSHWYRGRPYKAKQFEDILSYADENGLVAVPALPAARVLKDRIFEPEVARLYRRRIGKHIRRYGNHPSVCMWLMNFNLAGYRWNHAPTTIDGSYRPNDAAWRKKERYSLEAQRIAQTIDPRPIYHHACGRLGDIFTLNCYIGPTSPLQEREEWPSRWAEKRPFPLIACEHGLWLVPYWYRPRVFPLSVVYGGQPIFDELAAMVLGPRAYRALTPDVFDLYGLPKGQLRTRLIRLIDKHQGYQEVKSLLARHSLRAWRAHGMSGIIFNAIQWDFRDETGRPLPVMRALQHYFGPTDFYVAGPKGNFPSKDHAFYVGERIKKQIVLLNDLTRDVKDTLRWQVGDGRGGVRAQGELAAVFRAGVPSFMPFAFTAPNVSERTELALTVRSVAKPKWEDSVRIHVFPPARRPPIRNGVLVYDPVGDTTNMLRRANVSHSPFTEDGKLAKAALLIAGRKCWDDEFLSLAKRTRLEEAVAKGLNLLVFEQTRPEVLGLKLTERSTRRAFIAWRGHPALDGLAAADLIDLRGASDLIEPYPNAPPETEKKYPKRFYKWSNRGVVATFVYTKPHHAPYVPILHCGFDLVESPLMQARFGRGRVVLCQIDVTPRCGTDPVSTKLVGNLLEYLTTQVRERRQAQLIPVDVATRRHGLRLAASRFFKGKITDHPLLAGLSDGDLYLKQWHEQPVAQDGNGWRVIAEPGIVAVKNTANGLAVVCTLDPTTFGKTRARIKALRFVNTLRSNLGEPNPAWQHLITAPGQAYEPNIWEEIPPYQHW